mgnify:CR=1 FL=1
MKNISILISILFLATSCGIMHNVPQTNDPNVFVKPNMNTFFVDQNGNFYHANWKKTYGNPPRKGNKHEYSLKKKELISEQKSHQKNVCLSSFMAIMQTLRQLKFHIIS